MRTAIWLSFAFTLAACADANLVRSTAGVTPIAGGQTAAVSSDDLVIALGRSGFSPAEILEHGPALRNALAVRGGAELREDGQLTAILSVMDGALYVVSQRGGTYVHDLYR